MRSSPSRTAGPEALSGPIAAFERNLRFERRMSAHTVVAYIGELERFAEFVQRGGTARWHDVTAALVQSFVAARHRQGIGPRSLQRTLSAIRAFFRHGVDQGVFFGNPAAGVRAPRAPAKLPELLEVDRVGALLDFDPEDLLALRDRAMLELFYSCGLRLSELVGLDLKDLDLRDAMVEVTGKGDKGRIRPNRTAFVKRTGN